MKQLRKIDAWGWVLILGAVLYITGEIATRNYYKRHPEEIEEYDPKEYTDR